MYSQLCIHSINLLHRGPRGKCWLRQSVGVSRGREFHNTKLDQYAGNMEQCSKHNHNYFFCVLSRTRQQNITHLCNSYYVIIK